MNSQMTTAAGEIPAVISPDSSGKSRFLYGAALAVLFVLVTWPLILSGTRGQDETGAASDQVLFHYPIIQDMVRDWPHPNLIDLHGIQMAPTFHVLMAALVHYCHFDLTGLRLTTSVAGLLLLISVYWFTNKWVEPRAAFVLSLTYLFSPFMLSGAMWLMTDNFAWLFVSLALGWTAMYPAVPKRVLGSGVATAVATAFRQVHLWLIAPIGVAGFLEMYPERFRALALPFREPSRHPGRLWTSIIVALVAPILVILYFVSLWHGLIPPGTAQKYGTNNHFKIIPLALAQTAFCSVFLLPAVLERATLKARLRDWRVWTGAVICFLLAALPRSAEKQSPSGALVSLAGRTPVIFDRLLILLVPGAFAGAALVIFFLAARERGRAREAFFLIFGFVCWLTAQTAPVFPLRRYCDFIQVIIIWLVVLGLPQGGARRRALWIGAIAFALVQCGMTVLKVYLPVFRG